MKYVAIGLTAGAAIIVLAASACAAESNALAGKILPARSMLTMGGIVSTPERQASPIFAGKELPVPPRQRAAWPAPKTDLPENYVSATALLFQQGMTDPRGCDYREIEVGTGNVWSGDGGVVETHGWVLPGGQPSHFAVCWNGLVYPVVSVGTNADLEADVANLVTNGFTTWYSAIPEGMSVSQGSLLGIKGCLLLRLGRVDLATRCWQAQTRRGQQFRSGMWSRMMATNSPPSTNEVKLPDADPYLDWATEWAWAMFDRTVCAHMRGDEALALATARQLSEVQPKIEAECARRAFTRPQYPTPDWRSKPGPYLGFLDQLPQIVVDLEHRAKEPCKKSILDIGITNYPEQTKRIATLIDDLDLVNARQWGQPGWFNLPEDPIVSALIQEGDPAVEPLLDCVDNDKRLTRSVGFGRDFFRSRTVIPVHDAARVALLSILQAGFSDGTAEIHAYWNKYKDMNLDERCYSILNDDSAGSRWLEVAAHITQPGNVATFPRGLSIIKPAPTNAPVRMRGEILRAKSNPSVAELMARRALEVPTNSPNAYDLSAACQMTLYLAVWDPPAALSVARTLSKRACTVMKYSGQQLGSFVTKLAMARAQAGDPQAFDDYADWMIATTPEQLGFSIRDCLEPLQKFPTNQILQAAAEKMFADTNSAWSRLPWKEMHGDNPIGSDLVSVPAFRLLLIREMEKTNVCGSFTWNEPGRINYAIANYQSGGYGAISFTTGDQPTNGATSEMRWCDWIAFSLSNGKQIPFFNPFAPVEKRDEAIEKAKKLLGQR